MAVLTCKLYFQQHETNYKRLRYSYYGLGCDAAYFGRYTPMFWRNVLLPTSRWNWTTLGKWPVRHKNEERKLVMS